MPLVAPDLFKSSAAAASSRPRVVRQPNYAEYIERAKCWLGEDVTGGKKQVPHMYDALSLHVDATGNAGQYTAQRAP